MLICTLTCFLDSTKFFLLFSKMPDKEFNFDHKIHVSVFRHSQVYDTSNFPSVNKYAACSFFVITFHN